MEETNQKGLLIEGQQNTGQKASVGIAYLKYHERAVRLEKISKGTDREAAQMQKFSLYPLLQTGE